MTTAEAREAFVAGLRELAAFLESHPEVEAPRGQKLLLSLHTTDAVLEFAKRHGLMNLVRFDGEGNASVDVAFGPVVYHAYGYHNFTATLERSHEAQARTWAEKHDLVLVPAEQLAVAS